MKIAPSNGGLSEWWWWRRSFFSIFRLLFHAAFSDGTDKCWRTLYIRFRMERKMIPQNNKLVKYTIIGESKMYKILIAPFISRRRLLRSNYNRLILSDRESIWGNRNRAAGRQRIGWTDNGKTLGGNLWN